MIGHVTIQCAECGRRGVDSHPPCAHEVRWSITSARDRHPRPFVPLRSIAPRLGLARDQLLRERFLAGRQRAKLDTLIVAARALVAHRELQVVRAGAGRSGTYMRLRHDKLKVAKAELARLLEIKQRAA